MGDEPFRVSPESAQISPFEVPPFLHEQKAWSKKTSQRNLILSLSSSVD
jgi:hypothetical protein